MKYVCPMHGEVTQNTPGKCPKCGMELVDKSKAVSTQESQNSYRPLFVIIGIIFLVSFAIASKETFSVSNFITYFMTGFFLVFSAFKLMDLKGFADGYAMYDLLAKKWQGYGYIYPFIELFFGIAMILQFSMKTLLWVELFIMLFSGSGVLIKILKKEKFQCACLGTFLKVPLTYVTLIEDFGMALLAGVLLLSS